MMLSHDDLNALMTRDSVDNRLGEIWTLICDAEDRDYTAAEIDEIISACSSVSSALAGARDLLIQARTEPLMSHITDSQISSVSGDTGKRRPNKVDQHRVDQGEIVRAGGDVACDHCGHLYYDHPAVVGFEWLRRACDGRLLKL